MLMRRWSIDALPSRGLEHRADRLVVEVVLLHRVAEPLAGLGEEVLVLRAPGTRSFSQSTTRLHLGVGDQRALGAADVEAPAGA